MTVVVLDASAGVELVMQTPIGRRLQERIPRGATAWVPEHYFSEVAGVLRRYEFGGALDAVRVRMAVDRLRLAPLTRVQVRPLLAEAWQRRHNLTISDALYVVLAEHLGAPLVTTDLRLASAPGLRISTIVA